MVQTPNLDRLAGQGARWSRAYAGNPLCTPNRACIMTGRFSHQTGMIINNRMLPPQECCLAEVLVEQGYATHYIGKWHMDGPASPGFIPPGWRRRGFQTFEGFNRGHYYPKGAKYFTNDGKLVSPNVFESCYQTDLAIDFIKQHRKDPFCCFLSWGPPHTPYDPPDDYRRFFEMKELQYRTNVHESLHGDKRLHDFTAGYYGLCELLDHEIGRLLGVLGELDLENDTIVVFTSDHGDMLGSHDLYFKSKPHEESLHIPLSMRWPGHIRSGQVTDTLVSSIDLMPTLLSMCGLAVPHTCTGRDLSAAVLSGAAPQVDSIYAEGAITSKPQPANAALDINLVRMGEWRAVITATHKLFIDLANETFLYDLEKDPYEMNNLAESRQHAALRQHLLDDLKRWGKETGDPFPGACAPAKEFYTDEEAAI